MQHLRCICIELCIASEVCQKKVLFVSSLVPAGVAGGDGRKLTEVGIIWVFWEVIAKLAVGGC